MQEYLKSTNIIDWQHPLVLEQALKLSNKLDNPIEIAKNCFEWVIEDINAEFCPPVEHLAFTVELKGEADLPEIWPEPLPIIVKTLSKYHRYNDILNNLPDIPLIL